MEITKFKIKKGIRLKKDYISTLSKMDIAWAYFPSLTCKRRGHHLHITKIIYTVGSCEESSQVQSINNFNVIDFQHWYYQDILKLICHIVTWGVKSIN